MERLPLGIQTFEKVVEDDYLYVDKTEAIHKLITTAGNAVFLSRPRRFGKSLLCSTLPSIFEGKRELFQGFAIDALDWHWTKYPIIHIDFNAGDYSEGKSTLSNNIDVALTGVVRKYDVELSEGDVSSKFTNLIRDLYYKFNQKVVVIIDEYDKPLLSTMDAPELHKELRGMLKGFFGVLKPADQYLQFSFITGVTKFSKVSIFSDLNQLDDITFKPAYADLCGITQEELEYNFNDGIKEYSKVNELSEEDYKKNLKDFYNGYRFSEKDLTVYNPFGLIHHFMNDGKFEPYWFNSGTPTFLYRLLKDQHIDIQSLDDLIVSKDSFVKFDIEDLQAVPVLYQSGYLTIKDYSKDSSSFTLGFPNEEVSSAFSKHLLTFMFPRIGNETSQSGK
jgi:hypothetical protein